MKESTSLNAIAQKAPLSFVGAVFGLTIFLFAAIGTIGHDAYTYHSLLRSEYKTPWFSEHWWKNPYTHVRLMFHPSTEYWTENAVRSERWLVREHDVNGTKFWTTLQRLPIEQ